ncbi:MAG: hypothetical protein IE885_00990 [Campylobacterales bacterium]|nr:hypothetical protein [Campylobacterales bacterium]
MSSSPCFVTQIATKEILLRVTNVCGECYDDLKEGDEIYYDMQNYRYLCKKCQEALCERMNDRCEIIEEEGQALF